ncbi:MAG TPA: glycoside hydrolase family 172 protein [Streptosporangiaceae bacterium]|nr:glycoside hydrolase family 172 protein [Streptosporangiaceae bacterium]
MSARPNSPIRHLKLVLFIAAAAAAFAPAAMVQAAGTRAAQQARSAAAGTAPGLVYGAGAATQLSQLPYLQPTTVAGGQSSFDRDTYDGSHGNQDFGHFLATGRAGNVMLNQQGPGCVYRLWVSSLQTFFPDNWIKIYFDGSSKPSIDMTMAQMFAGTNAPFLSPLVDNNQTSSGGYVSYVPLCYHTSIKIVTNMDRYYNIGYVTYPPGSNVKTWSPLTDTSAMRKEWSNATADPLSTASDFVASGKITLPSATRQTMFSVSGPASVQSIKINVPGVTVTPTAASAATLDHIWIRIYWDGSTTPSVNAPVGSFFGMGQFGSYPTHAMVVGMDASNHMYMYLPMPFQRHATIQLVNTGAASISGISYEVKYRPFTGSFTGVSYFKTSYLTSRLVPVGKDIPVLRATGSGKFIGIVASYAGGFNRTYLEGDERIYVDGSGSPSFYGTGGEDFFNGAFYFYYGPYSQQLSGNTAHVLTKAADETAAYRLFVQEAIPFRRGIVVTIQHGGYDNTKDTSASMLAYYYQRSAPQMVLTDTLNVGNRASERSHKFVITRQSWAGSRTYQYVGTADTVNITDTGRADTGYSQFTMAIKANNHGVDLRRRYDQGVTNQKVKVYVNGHLVGVWFVAGSNIYHRWADSDFIIPAWFTSGKRSITIRVQFLPASTTFTEFRYWAYSLTS